MGISMVDCGVGTIVWVRRKNGTWWPGRVVGLNELSSLRIISTGTGTPIKLLVREDGRVDWYNLEKSKRIKAFRCGEFDDCIERAESSQAYPTKKLVKYAHLEDAILHALELEKQEPRMKHKKPAGKEWVGAVFRAKRSKCVYFPAESNNCLERTIFHPRSQHVSHSPFVKVGCSLQPGSAEERISSISTKSDFSKSVSRNQGRGEAVTQSSGSYGGHSGNTNCKEHDDKLCYFSDFPPEDQTATDVGVQKWKVEGKLKINNPNKRPGVVTEGQRYVRSKKGTRDIGYQLTSNAASVDHIRTGFGTKSGENLVCEENTPSQSALGYGYLEDPDNQCICSVNIGHQDRMVTLLDVDVTIQASYQEEHVPLVSLMSRLNGRAIRGYPIDIEALEDSCRKILLPKNDDGGHHLFDDEGILTVQLVWRTSRRTPVCYIPRPDHSSAFKDDKPVQDFQNSGHLSPKAEGNSSPPTRKVLRMPLKRCSLSKKKTRKLNQANLQPASQSCTTDRLLKPEERVPTRLTCVPVKLIFSKLLGGVGRMQAESATLEV